MRVWAVSDIHVDYAENFQWIQQLSSREYQDDVLILAGDVSHDPTIFSRCMSVLLSKFSDVFFVPGNHDLWVKQKQNTSSNSLEKLDNLLQLCENLSVHTTPARVNDIYIVPLLSWYDSSLAKDDPPLSDQDNELLKGWSDTLFCKWPDGSNPVDLLKMRNEQWLPPNHYYDEGVPIISFSHMVPRRDLLPPQTYYQFLPYVTGSTSLEEQIRRLGPTVHVFGHSHIPRDEVHDGIRYVQAPLAYPRERRIYRHHAHLLQVWSET